jgi:nitroimidazol reductase NimA-like FMN-containing flavoprotein (pyridoxamine 5'-phosphate oxidase superfamily)
MSDPKMSEQDAKAFLAEPHVGVLSVASDDGRPPLSVPIWYAYEVDGYLTIFTGTGGHPARKTRLIKKAGAISFTVQYPEWPYRYVTAECSLVKTEQPPSAEAVIAIVSRYMSAEEARAFAERELASGGETFTLFTFRPDRWLSVDYGKTA